MCPITQHMPRSVCTYVHMDWHAWTGVLPGNLDLVALSQCTGRRLPIHCQYTANTVDSSTAVCKYCLSCWVQRP